MGWVPPKIPPRPPWMDDATRWRFLLHEIATLERMQKRQRDNMASFSVWLIGVIMMILMAYLFS